MKLDKITSKNDENYTPPYAVLPITKYLRQGSHIWCPFDTEDSWFVKVLRDQGHKVTYSHISSQQDFFDEHTWEDKGDIDYIISNPPYSVKGQVLDRLFREGVPFAMLVGVVGLFESQTRFEMFRDNSFEIMYLNRRVSFFEKFEDQTPRLNPPFSSVYITHNILPSQIVFEEIDKTITDLPDKTEVPISRIPRDSFRDVYSCNTCGHSWKL